MCCVGFAATSASARCGASLGNSRRPVGTGSAWRVPPRRGDDAGLRARSSTRSRAKRAAPRVAIGAALLGRLRQRDEQRSLADATSVAAPCRSRRATPRARPRYCRRTAPAAGKREDLVLVEMVLELERADDLAELGDAGALVAASSRRAACMVSVEAPETSAGWRRAAMRRARASAVDAAMVVEALVLEREQHGEIARVDIVGSTGRRQRPSAVVKARSSRSRRSRTVVEIFWVASRFGGPSRSMAT